MSEYGVGAPIFHSHHEDSDIMLRLSPEFFVNFEFLSDHISLSAFDIHTVYLHLTEVVDEQF